MAVCSMPKPEEFEKLCPKDFLYINRQRNMSKQIFCMAEMIMIPDSEMYEKEKIVADLIDLLKPYYPDCDILIFGSSGNGFGFKGCDLDLLFLPFPDYSNFKFTDKRSGGVPKPHLIQKGTVSRKKLLDMNEKMHLQFIKRIMYQSNYLFESIVFIPARCPILNMKFLNSSISCDFSASNRTVVYNTQLLWLFGNLDHRVKPLVMVLRYWAKSLGFISKSTLSSYSFTLMVIFFLQNTNPAILPPVKFLKELAGYSRIVDVWDTAVCMDIRHIISFRHENSSPLGQLFKEFFKFYWEFDFVNNVVSPYHGRAISVEEIKTSKDALIRSFQVTPFSLQDPFILSKNLDRCSKKKTSFKLALLIATKLLLKEELSHEFFSLSHYQQEMASMLSHTKMNLPSSSVFIPVQLTYEMDFKLKTAKTHSWLEKIYRIVFDILQQGLCIECEVVDTDKAVLVRKTYEPLPKKRKINAYGEWCLQLIISMQCVVNFPTIWKRNRTQIQEHVDSKVNKHSDDSVDNHPVESVINELNKQSSVEVGNCSSDKEDKISNYENNDHSRNIVNDQLNGNEYNSVLCKVDDQSNDTLNDNLYENVDNRLNSNKNIYSCENEDDQSDDKEDILPSLIKDYRISKKLTRGGICPISPLVTIEEKPYLIFLCNFYKYPDSQISDIIIGFSPLTNEKVFYEVRDFLQSFVRKHIKSILEEGEMPT